MHELDVDWQASGSRNDVINQTRQTRAKAYFENDSTFPELSALTLVVDIIDSEVLYRLLGDPLGKDNDQACKVKVLLDPETSAIGECSTKLLHLLDAWLVGGHNRVPWCIMDIVGAPLTDQKCMLFTRSAILRLSSAFARRFLTKYST